MASFPGLRDLVALRFVESQSGGKLRRKLSAVDVDHRGPFQSAIPQVIKSFIYAMQRIRVNRRFY